MKRRSRNLFLAMAASLCFSRAEAQPRRETVLLHCGSYRQLAQASDNAPPVDHYANCTEELRRVLEAGFTLFSVESGDAPAPFFTLLAPESRRKPRATRVDAALLSCGWNAFYDEYHVRSASVTTGSPTIGTGEATHCANALAELMGAGFDLARVHVAKDGFDAAYFLLMRGGETRLRERRHRESKTILLTCRPDRSPSSTAFYVVHLASSDPLLGVPSQLSSDCAEAWASLVEMGYRDADFQSGERESPFTLTLIKPK